MSGAGIYIKTPSGLVAAATVPGPSGSQGPQSSLVPGTITTGAAGTSAAATITGAGPVQTLNLTIPKGDPGGWVQSTLSGTVDLNTLTTAGLYFCDAPSTNLPVPGSGTYVEVQRASGTSIGQRATVSQTGRVFVRNLYAGSWLPWVELAPKGSIGGSDLTGTGSPSGVVSAPVGTYYTDTAGTNGAWRWIKKSSTGTSGWEVDIADTGWRAIANDATYGFVAAGNLFGAANGAAPANNLIVIRRVNNQVFFTTTGGVQPKQDYTTATRNMFILPPGFRSWSKEHFVGRYGNNDSDPGMRVVMANANASYASPAYFQFCPLIDSNWGNFATGGAWPRTYGGIWMSATYTTNDAWPTTLPGTAA